MYSLQQARAVFNPLPLAAQQDPDLAVRFRELAKDAQSKLLALAKPTQHTQANVQEDQAKLRSLINSLNVQKNLGLWWNQGLQNETLGYWKDRVTASEVPWSLYAYGSLTSLIFRSTVSW